MTNYFSIQHFRMTNLSFIILKKIPLCMRLIAIMLFVCIGLAYASDSYSQSATLTLNVNNKTVQEVLDEIEKQSEFRFFYNNKQVNTNRVVSIQSKKRMYSTFLNNYSTEQILVIRFWTKVSFFLPKRC